MNARLKPIETAVATRPAYDNTHLGNERAWIAANAEALRAWFKECSAYVGGPFTEADYRGFARAQHDVQRRFLK
jgi:hypothetical protein